MAEEPQDPNLEHEKKTTVPDAPKISPDDAWGLRLNPVRETPSVAKNLGAGGGAAK